MRTAICAGLVLFLLVLPFYYLESGQTQDHGLSSQGQSRVRESLIQQLTTEGFDRAFVQSLLHDSRWELSLTILDKNLIYREFKANYDRFLDDPSTRLSEEFLEENRAFLEKTETDYGVDKEVIVAILLIESRFGLYAERYRVFNALSSLSLANHPEVFPVAYAYLKKSYPDLTEKYLQERAERRSRWAYKELKALLRIGIREELDVLDIKGSFAGAFGLPQFIPTSYLAYAADGNGDKAVHLFDRQDAIASVANYLKAHGWKSGSNEEEKLKVLFRYNRSRLYGETVLKCAGKLNSKALPS
jgi:membrane-bound lytic murein transglycosylase B